MNKKLTDITIVVDRSGSMGGRDTEASQGIRDFVSKQKEAEGECTFTLMEFNQGNVYVQQAVDIKDARDYTLVPSGLTALYDALGRAITDTSKRIKEMPKKDRPGLVVFVIVTDGLENSSQEYDSERIKAMISKKERKKGWQFTYLGANQDAFAESAKMGIKVGQTVSFDESKFQGAYNTVSESVTRSRVAAMTGNDATLSYTDKEKKDLE